MKNKILVELIIPELDENYNVYIPINRKIGNVINLVSKAVNELTNGVYQIKKNSMLYNKESGKLYEINDIVYNTDIRNGTQLILF